MFIRFPFLACSTVSMIAVIGPYWCCLFSICWANADLFLLKRMFLICSLYLVKFLPIWPMYVL
jgi:hypothetical protein